MRSLHEVLPIVREVLNASSHPGNGCQPYTCVAAAYAAGQGLITMEEEIALTEAIGRELSPSTTIYGSMCISLPASSYDPDFWPLRDKWLDNFQAKLEVLAGKYDPEKDPHSHPAHD